MTQPKTELETGNEPTRPSCGECVWFREDRHKYGYCVVPTPAWWHSVDGNENLVWRDRSMWDYAGECCLFTPELTSPPESDQAAPG